MATKFSISYKFRAPCRSWAFRKTSGLDVDFRYLNTDGNSFQSANAFVSNSFSSVKNQTGYDAAATFGFTKNYQGKSGNLNGVTKVGGA
ncbi:hypothetical protein GCM10007049_30840 [Echinicola pacifica]|uniref:Uncharacterized protein n=1 Tax=Echinicola pacifica TaxID=346377 RepID=A0A918Q971_9BACT|nr:hypothetical protein GCM10007049_30840 [Echinicola pacifica]